MSLYTEESLYIFGSSKVTQLDCGSYHIQSYDTYINVPEYVEML